MKRKFGPFIPVVVTALFACAAWAGTSEMPGTRGPGGQAQQPVTAAPQAAGPQAGTPGTAQNAPGGSGPVASTPPLGDIGGLWFFSSSMHKVSGPCPPGKPSIGKAMIGQDGSQVTLDFISGAVCKPASVCHYTGSMSGGKISLSNSASADDEGGTVSNTLSLLISSREQMTGKSGSKYVHPEGRSCSWSSEIELARSSPAGKGGASGMSGSPSTGGATTGSQNPASGRPGPSGSTPSSSGGSSGSGSTPGGR